MFGVALFFLLAKDTTACWSAPRCNRKPNFQAVRKNEGRPNEADKQTSIQ